MKTPLLIPALALAFTASASAQVLIDVNFNETGTSAINAGSLGNFTMRNATNTVTDLHSADGLGVSGQPGDRAFSNTSAVAGTTGMGSGFTGGRAVSANTGTGGALNAFTLSGWFRTSSTTQIGNLANLFVWQDTASDGFQLQATSAGGSLRLLVNGTSVDSSASFSATQEWVFFAATYDASLGSNQARFYVGGTSSSVAAAGEATLAGGAVDITSGAMGIGNNGARTSPFDGLLDQFQLSTGAMDGAQLEGVRLAAVPEPSSLLLIAVGVGVYLVFRRRLRAGIPERN